MGKGNYPSKRFNLVVHRDKKPKVISLECETQRQADEWYKALMAGINETKKTSDMERLRQMNATDLIFEVKQNFKVRHSVGNGSKDFPLHDKGTSEMDMKVSVGHHTKPPNLPKVSISKGEAYKNIASKERLTLTKNDFTPHSLGSNFSKEDDASTPNNSVGLTTGCEKSVNYRNQDFSDFAPADDIISVATDHNLKDEHQLKKPESPRQVLARKRHFTSEESAGPEDEKNVMLSVQDATKTALVSSKRSNSGSSSSESKEDVDIKIQDKKEDVNGQKVETEIPDKDSGLTTSRSVSLAHSRSCSTFKLGKINKDISGNFFLNVSKVLERLPEENDDNHKIGSTSSENFGRFHMRSLSTFKTARPELPDLADHKRRTSASLLVKLNEYG
jgi:hypothetical protein